MTQPVTLPEQATQNMSSNATDALLKGHSAIGFVETATVAENTFFDIDTDTAYSVSQLISNPELVDIVEIFFAGETGVLGLGPGTFSFNPELNLLVLEDTAFESVSFKVLKDATFQEGGTFLVQNSDEFTFVQETSAGEYYRIGDVSYDAALHSYTFDYALL